MPKHSVQIRVAQTTDCNGLASLSRQLGYPSTPEEVSARLALILEKTDHQVLTADKDGFVVGWIEISINYHLYSEPFAEINGLVVDESHRGMGIGNRLIKQAESWAREKKLTRLRVRSNVIRSQTHSFYLRLGFTIQKDQHVFQKELSFST